MHTPGCFILPRVLCSSTLMPEAETFLISPPRTRRMVGAHVCVCVCCVSRSLPASMRMKCIHHAMPHMSTCLAVFKTTSQSHEKNNMHTHSPPPPPHTYTHAHSHTHTHRHIDIRTCTQHSIRTSRSLAMRRRGVAPAPPPGHRGRP